MCLTPIVDYVPRPVKEAARPDGGQPSLAAHDPNLYGPRPTPPQWHELEVESSTPETTHSSSTAAMDTAAVAAAFVGLEGGSRRIESVLIELPSGRRLLVTEL
jgi:hypothetical protein